MAEEPPALVAVDDDDIPELVPTEEKSVVKSSRKVPITLLTGFLGAGKTTLLNYILTKNHHKRIAIVQNEFGDQIGLEEAMLKGGVKKHDEEKNIEWLEFDNGCICCSVRDEVTMAMEGLVAANPELEYIFIETTGMADPGTLVRAFWVDAELQSNLYLDAIVTVVDAKFFLTQLTLESSQHEKINEAERQVAFADVILINKVDLVDDDQLTSLKARLDIINVFAPRHQTIRGKMDIAKLLDIKAFDPKRVIPAPPKHHDHKHSKEHHHDHKHSKEHHHDHGHEKEQPSNRVGTCVVEFKEQVTLEFMNRFLGHLLWEVKTHEVYRLKGVVHIKGENQKYNCQGVNDIFEIEESGVMWGKDEERKTALVFIGRRLDVDGLMAYFKKAYKEYNKEK